LTDSEPLDRWRERPAAGFGNADRTKGVETMNTNLSQERIPELSPFQKRFNIALAVGLSILWVIAVIAVTMALYRIAHGPFETAVVSLLLILYCSRPDSPRPEKMEDTLVFVTSGLSFITNVVKTIIIVFAVISILSAAS
jgi:hypothetical protein